MARRRWKVSDGTRENISARVHDVSSQQGTRTRRVTGDGARSVGPALRRGATSVDCRAMGRTSASHSLRPLVTPKYTRRSRSVEILFAASQRLTGLNLGLIVIDCLKKLNLESKYCIGVTTDDCSVITSESCGAVATVKKEWSNAVYSLWHNHILNLFRNPHQ